MAEVLTLHADSIDSQALDRAASALMRGGLVIYPTDTFYGIAVDPRSAAAAEKLFEAKGRDRDRATPLIAGSLRQAEQAVVFNQRARQLADRFWPGPLTLVLDARPAVRRELLGGLHTAAVRVPAHAVARALADAVGFCITATSANLTGRPPALSPDDLDAALLAVVDVVLDAGSTPGGLPSTIVDVSSEPPRLVRAGAIAFERVLESLE